MKIYHISAILWLLFAMQAQAQFSNQGGAVHITTGSAIKALDGVINTAGGTLTVDGTLTTPADLSNSSGATLQGDGQYFIGGNWSNDATFNAGASTVTFDGAQNSTATSGGAAFYLLALNKSGGNNLLLADDMNVTNTLDFQATDNYVVLGEFNLQAGDILGYEASRHVRTTGAGSLLRTVGATPVVFPVGHTSYNPATLTNDGTSDLFRVRVDDAVRNGGYSGSAYLTDAVGRSWFVEETTPGGSDLTLTLQWNGGDELSGFDRSMAYVSHFDGGSWDNQAVSGAGGAGPYTLSRTGITALSPFAVLGSNFQPTLDILGRILWKGDGLTGVKDATVTASGDLNGMTVTDINGDYTLTLAGNGNVSITPTKAINLLNGVDVNDALAIQQYLVGIYPVSDPYTHIAMDVDRSDYISTFDALLIRQYLLGNPFAADYFNKSWRFVPKAYPLALPPWGFPEKIDLTGVNSNQSGQDFYGVKIGDVVASFADPATLSGQTAPLVLALHANDALLKSGSELTTVFRAGPFPGLAAWQFALQFDPARLELLDVEPLDGLPLETADFGLFRAAEGELRSVWAQPAALILDDAQAAFRLRFRVLQGGGRLRDALRLESAILPALAYAGDRVASAIALYFDQTNDTNTPEQAGGFSLLQNQPNPYVSETTIGFVLPAGGCEAQLRIYDAAGREWWRTGKYYPGGYNAERVRLEDAAVSGSLFYELTTPWGTQTKRMVRVSR